MESGHLRQCDNSQEDPTCSYQWEYRVYEWSFENHDGYLNRFLKDVIRENGCGVDINYV